MSADDILGILVVTAPISIDFRLTGILGIAVSVGSYFGVFQRQETKLPGGELVDLFFLWLLSPLLPILISALLIRVKPNRPQHRHLIT